jgi:hypothetical protein
LIAASAGTSLAIATARAQQLITEGERPVLIMHDNGGLRLTPFDESPAQGIGLEFDGQAQTAGGVLDRSRPPRLEIMDPTLSPALLEIAARLDLPIDLWITTDLCLSHVDAAARLLAPTETAWAFTRAKLPGRDVLLRTWPAQRLFLAGFARGATKVLAVLPASPSARAWQTIAALAARFQHFKEPVQIVVAGATADDQTLMAFPNVFVTGRVEADELRKVLAAYNPGWLLTDFEHPLFGHPLVETVRTANRPVAFRDWSFGSVRSRHRDLAIDANATEASLADAVARWIERS